MVMNVADSAINIVAPESVEKMAHAAINAGNAVVYGAHFLDGRLVLSSSSAPRIVSSFFETTTGRRATRRRVLRRWVRPLVTALPVFALLGLVLLSEKQVTS